MLRHASTRNTIAARAQDLFPGVLALPGVRAQVARIVDRRLGATGRSHGPLQPDLTLWLCLAMALLRQRSIPDVFSRLLSAWRAQLPGIGLRDVTDGALAHARDRLGPSPLCELFEALAADADTGPEFFGRRVWALDCTCLTMPDTPANDLGYGRQKSAKGRSAFPQAMAATLVAVRTHEVRAASLLPFSTPESWATLEFLQHLGAGDVVLLDRNFSGAWFLRQVQSTGARFVARTSIVRRPKILARLAPGDFDVVVKPTHVDPLRPDKSPLVLRMVEYRVGGREPIRLLTNLPRESVHARAVAGLYHERWEAEASYDELKTHLLGASCGTLSTTFRGRSPRMVDQEFYADLCLFNLLRRLLGTAARRSGIDPRRIAFVAALHVVGDSLADVENVRPQDRLRLYLRILDDLAQCALRRWRRARSCPRAVRIKTVRWPRKRLDQRCRPTPPLDLRLRMGARG